MLIKKPKEKFMQQTISYEIYGNGPETIFILHDWFNDKSSYETIRPYLNTGFYKFVFVDLRGYGASKNITGSCTLEEAAQDVIAIADKIGAKQFHLVGHSMSGQIAQYIPTEAPERAKSIVAICPVPACGSPAPLDIKEYLMNVTKGDIDQGKQIVHFMTQNRYHDFFAERKTLNWFNCSSPHARAAYLNMFCETDVQALVKGQNIPILVICGEFDAPAHNKKRMEETILKDFKNATLVIVPSGHYPMDECPVILAAEMDKFWKSVNSRCLD